MRRGGNSNERERSAPRPRRANDQDVLALRGEGLSFAAIASRLGLQRSKDAFDSFHRALQSSDELTKPGLIREELGRLETLEARIRSRDSAEPEKMQHRLEALEKMRIRTTRIAG